ncbi:unnamed protein product [Calicophoron daubneyi]|uniref:Dehydrogenase/reductase SDR family member 12 n=1 Tax=Calicophoron daubneyi TaxID=300641 RepID=A0AAV2TBD7_CALDB
MSWYRNCCFLAKGLSEFTRSGYESAASRFSSNDVDGIRLDNRRALVTGANSGIGLVCCIELAKRGAEVHMICRDPQRGEKAREQVVEAANDPRVKVCLHKLDMSKPKEVAEFSKKFVTEQSCLDILINNAGCMVNEFKLNPDGIEANFATNVLGTYILTEGLIPALGKSTDARVIVVSSGGMLTQKLDHANPVLVESTNHFDGTAVYAQNKRQQVVMTEMWAKMYENIHFSSMHPGWADTPAVASSMPDFYRKMQGRLRTPEQGADTAVWLALTPNIKQYPSGSFFQDRKPVAKHLPLAWTHSSDQEKEQFMDQMKEFAKPYLG